MIADVKYSRGSDSDVTSVSTSQAAHNQTFVNTLPPGYGFYFTPGVNMMPQSIYGTAPLYPVPATNTGSVNVNNAFPKGNTGYGSHTYNSGYDSLTAVAQTQDYVKQSYAPTTVQQHAKNISGSNTSDLSGPNPSAIYGKTHAQMTKVSIHLHLIHLHSLKY